MTPFNRAYIRIMLDPLNKWCWYELFKSGYQLEMALWLALQRGYSRDAVLEGYREYGQTIKR